MLYHELFGKFPVFPYEIIPLGTLPLMSIRVYIKFCPACRKALLPCSDKRPDPACKHIDHRVFDVILSDIMQTPGDRL